MRGLGLLLLVGYSLTYLPGPPAAVWRVSRAYAQDKKDDPSKWPADKKVEEATKLLKNLKDDANKFSKEDCPKTKADWDKWFEKALKLAACIIALMDSTRQIRKTGAKGDKLKAWDAEKNAGNAPGLSDLLDQFDKCADKVKESDKDFKPPSRDNVIHRAYHRIVAEKRQKLTGLGIPLEAKDDFKNEGFVECQPGKCKIEEEEKKKATEAAGKAGGTGTGGGEKK